MTSLIAWFIWMLIQAAVLNCIVWLAGTAFGLHPVWVDLYPKMFGITVVIDLVHKLIKAATEEY